MRPYRWTVSNIKSVPFGHKWTISVLGILINNPVVTLLRICINIVTKQIYNSGIVKYILWCTYSPFVPKRDTFMLKTVQPCLKLLSGKNWITVSVLFSNDLPVRILYLHRLFLIWDILRRFLRLRVSRPCIKLFAAFLDSIFQH